MDDVGNDDVGNDDVPTMTWQVMLLALCSAIKLAFCTWCEIVVRGSRGKPTETARAVLADNQNDVVLSLGALIATVITQLSMPLWCAQPAGDGPS